MADGQVERRSAESGRLHKQLSSFGVLLLTLSCLSPVFSIFGVGSDVLQHAGTGAAPLFVLGIAAAFVWAALYAELGSAYPYAGGDYVGVGSILGGWAGVVTLAIWAVTMGPSIAFQAKIISTYVAQLAPGLPVNLTTYGGLAAAIGVALLAVRSGALVTGLFLSLEVVAVLVLIGAGLHHPTHSLTAVLSHPQVMNPSGLLIAAPLGALSMGAISAVYGTVGGNQALYFGEELADPHRRMGRVVVMACLIGALATALPVIAVVLGAPDLTAVLRSPAPMAAFATQSLGPWAGKALSASVALAIFNANIAAIMMAARLYYSLGRDGLFHARVNRVLCQVHAPSGAPRIATLVVGAFAALCCLLDSHTLLVFLTGVLVYGWTLVCLAVLVGRYKGLTGRPGYWRAPLFPLAPILGLAMAAVFAWADWIDLDSGRPSLIVMGVVVVAAALWSRLVLERRPGGWVPVIADA